MKSVANYDDYETQEVTSDFLTERLFNAAKEGFASTVSEYIAKGGLMIRDEYYENHRDRTYVTYTHSLLKDALNSWLTKLSHIGSQKKLFDLYLSDYVKTFDVILDHTTIETLPDGEEIFRLSGAIFGSKYNCLQKLFDKGVEWDLKMIVEYRRYLTGTWLSIYDFSFYLTVIKNCNHMYKKYSMNIFEDMLICRENISCEEFKRLLAELDNKDLLRDSSGEKTWIVKSFIRVMLGDRRASDLLNFITLQIL